MWISCWLSAGAGDVGRGWGWLEGEFNNKSRACNCNGFIKRLTKCTIRRSRRGVLVRMLITVKA